MTVKISTHEQAKKLIEEHDTFLFDCDGVVWIGNELLPHVKETITLLQTLGKTPIFVSNNSTKARTEYVKKLAGFGIGGVEVSQIINSAYSTAIYVAEVLRLPKDRKVWVLGQNGITAELQNLGYETLTLDDLDRERDTPVGMDDIQNVVDPAVGCVVVGLDFQLTYAKLGMTLQYLLDGKTPFIATNIDSTFPYKQTKLPGAGSIVETVAFACGRRPDAVCGKPNAGMMDSILAHHHLDKARTIMVGDRLNTDMRFGSANGIDTLLVLTGIDNEASVATGHPDVSFYANRLGDLYTLYSNNSSV